VTHSATRRPIQQLPPTLVNRIAAGEVIERPASVVKELVENALDAGATSVTVQIEDGGRELIRVIDDGGGIPPGEMSLAFASHATSKLNSDVDLFSIRTMGFRGEALASIGSVSHARILSRTRDDDSVAYEIQNRGGEVGDPQAAAGNIGTTVEVRHLFFNVPARRKFLKGTQTEFGYITEQLLRTALPMPGVAFKLFHNGRLTMDLPAVASAEERWLVAWPDEFREQRLPIEAGDVEVTLTGLIGLPELARPVAKYQHLFLNGRPIRDKFITHALREAYRGLTEPGRHPAAILLLTLPPQDVDVNVHPTKAEVRFKDSGRIHGLVLSAVRERLLGADLTPRATPAAAPVLDPQQRSTMQDRLAEFFKSMQPAVLPLPFGREVRGEGGAQPVSCSTPTSDRHSERSEEPSRIDPAARPVERQDQVQKDPSQSQDDIGEVGASNATDSFPPHPGRLPQGGEGARAIQLHNSYLVAETDDGLIIIDQHALHERLIFEDLFARVTRGPLESQRMLIPIVLPASQRQLDLLEQVRPLLEKLGIEAAPAGPDSAAVHAFPSFLSRLDPGEFVRELLERGEQELLDLTEEELLHEVLDMMACKAAVKAGDPLSSAEITALLARKDLVERSSNCPHGRPTTLRLSLKDLEKQFKRTGF
jgi:DNA mismatch repair protein MutL